MGRPPLPSSTRKTILLPNETWDAISDYRFANRIPSEAEAIRRLLQAALRGVAKKGKRDE